MARTGLIARSPEALLLLEELVERVKQGTTVIAHMDARFQPSWYPGEPGEAEWTIRTYDRDPRKLARQRWQVLWKEVIERRGIGKSRD